VAIGEEKKKEGGKKSHARWDNMPERKGDLAINSRPKGGSNRMAFILKMERGRKKPYTQFFFELERKWNEALSKVPASMGEGGGEGLSKHLLNHVAA